MVSSVCSRYQLFSKYLHQTLNSLRYICSVPREFDALALPCCMMHYCITLYRDSKEVIKFCTKRWFMMIILLIIKYLYIPRSSIIFIRLKTKLVSQYTFHICRWMKHLNTVISYYGLRKWCVFYMYFSLVKTHLIKMLLWLYPPRQLRTLEIIHWQRTFEI